MSPKILVFGGNNASAAVTPATLELLRASCSYTCLRKDGSHECLQSHEYLTTRTARTARSTISAAAAAAAAAAPSHCLSIL